MTDALIQVSAIEQALGTIETVVQARELRAVAVTALAYAKQAKFELGSVNRVARVKLQTERKAGELLAELEKDQGARNDLTFSNVGKSSEYRAVLSEACTTYQDAIRWQEIAEIPEEVFFAELDAIEANRQEITTNRVYHAARTWTREQDANGIIETPKHYVNGGDGTRVIVGDATKMGAIDWPYQYGVIVADPPWQYGFTIRRGIAEDNYSVMTTQDLCDMPVSNLAAPDSVLYLWATWPQLPIALQVMDAWGFEYITGFPWIKLTQDWSGVKMGVGHWVRGASEMVLVGKRGNAKCPKSPYLGLMSPNLPHSMKPEDVHKLAEQHPGPYLELFGRRQIVGWTVFGNEVQHDLFTIGA